MTIPATIEAMSARIAELDRDELRRLARATQQRHLGPGLPFASLQRAVITEAADRDPGLDASVKEAQRRVRQAMAAKLAEFKELRADHTYKTAVQSAVKRAAFAFVARDVLPGETVDQLLAPWREVAGDAGISA